MTLEDIYRECRNTRFQRWIAEMLGPYILSIPNTEENKDKYHFGGMGVRKDKVMVTLHYGEWHKTHAIDNETYNKIHELVYGHPSKTMICEAKVVDKPSVD